MLLLLVRPWATTVPPPPSARQCTPTCVWICNLASEQPPGSGSPSYPASTRARPLGVGVHERRELCAMDLWTGDHHMLLSTGVGTRCAPFPLPAGASLPSIACGCALFSIPGRVGASLLCPLCVLVCMQQPGRGSPLASTRALGLLSNVPPPVVPALDGGRAGADMGCVCV